MSRFCTVLLTLLVLLSPASAMAWCQSNSISQVFGPGMAGNRCFQECIVGRGVPLRWQNPCFEWALHQDGSKTLPRETLISTIDQSFNLWTSAPCPGTGQPAGFQVRFQATPAACNIDEQVADGGNANVISFLDDWSARGLEPSAFALTKTWFRASSGIMVGWDMSFNEEAWVWRDCESANCPVDDPASFDVDFASTMTHEAGHVFTVGHSEDDESATMFACAVRGSTNARTLEADDVEALCSIYADGFEDCCDFEPLGGYDPLCSSDRPETGCTITTPKRTREGRFPKGALALLMFSCAVVVFRRRFLN